MKSQRRTIRSAALAVAIAAIGATAFPVAAAQADSQADRVVRHDPAKAERVEHDLKGPLSERQAAQRQQAIEQVITGKSKVEERGSSDVVKLGKNKYVELAREKTDKIFVILAEFGTKTDPAYGGTPGPAHNEIAKPDPRTDNSTEWQADYNRQHFQDMYFSKAKDTESMAKYYERQSSGRYSVMRRGRRLGQGRLERGPVRQQQVRHLHLEPRRGRREQVGRRAQGRR